MSTVATYDSVNPPVGHIMTRRKLGIAVIGFGWMGQAHSRSYLRLGQLFTERPYEPQLVICADTVEQNRNRAANDFGFTETTDDWRAAVEHGDVDIVVIAAPNMLHEEIAVTAAEAGKHVFCEKPVGGTPEQTLRVYQVCETAGIVTGVGYNYRFAPQVCLAKQMIERGDLGEITNYRGRFFSMYGADPLGLLSWRFQLDQAGHGASTDILSHSMDLAMMLNGPITSVVGASETFITERPLPSGTGTHYDRGGADDPTGTVTNEDYFAALVRFANGSVGTFESSRAIVGPQSQMAFDIYGTQVALGWNLETMNEMAMFRLANDQQRVPQGYTTLYAGEAQPYHSVFVPGEANAIGFEDIVTIQDHEFLSAVAEGRPHSAGMRQALDYVSVQAALLQSVETRSWVDVISLAD